MSAAPTIATARLAPGDRVLVLRTDREGVAVPATTKTGAVRTTVTGLEKFHTDGTGHFGTVGVRTRYRISTTAGVIDSAPRQPFLLTTPARTTTTEETAMTTTVRKGTGRPAAAAKRTRAAQKVTPKPSPETGLPENFPGAKKLARLLDGAAEHGWTATLSDLDPATGAATVTVTRGEDSIRSEFIGGRSAGYSFHTLPDGKIRKLNNVSAVLHVMAGLSPSGHPLPAPAPIEDPTSAPPAAARPARSRQRSPRAAA